MFALLPFAGLLLMAVVQSTVVRFKGPAKFGRSMFMGFAAGGGCVAVAPFAASRQPGWLLGYVFLAAGAYVGLAFGYFAFLNLSRTSLRIRMLKELQGAPGGALPLTSLLEHYEASHVLEVRLERLLQGSQLVRHGECYLQGPNSTFLVLARVLDVLKLVIFGRRRPADSG